MLGSNFESNGGRKPDPPGPETKTFKGVPHVQREKKEKKERGEKKEGKKREVEKPSLVLASQQTV
jgi:hypothetical protein